MSCKVHSLNSDKVSNSNSRYPIVSTSFHAIIPWVPQRAFTHSQIRKHKTFLYFLMSIVRKFWVPSEQAYWVRLSAFKLYKIGGNLLFKIFFQLSLCLGFALVDCRLILQNYFNVSFVHLWIAFMIVLTWSRWYYAKVAIVTLGQSKSKHKTFLPNVWLAI